MISNLLRSVIIGLLTFSLVQTQETQGTPGVDYPNFVTIPNSSFKCSDQEFIPGFYADLETQCQVYHFCSEEGQETFLCPIGSIFNQVKLACDAWHNFNCTLAPQSYSSNSGFLLENAMKNVPLLIKLRNRAQNRRSFGVPVTNEHPSTEGSSESHDVNAEQNQDADEESHGEELNENESLDDILSRLEASIQNDEPSDGINHGDSGDENEESSENSQTNLFFDPVTEQYYTDPESSQNEWSQNYEDQFGFYDRENFAYKYGLAMQDAEESDFDKSSEPTDLYGFNEMNNKEVEDDQFLKRRMNTDQPFRRLRRKPIYTVIREDYDVAKIPIRMTDVDSVMDSEDGFSTDSVNGVNSQPSGEITTEYVEVPSTMAPFEMAEDLSRAHMTPLNITEVPMTSEEFEDSIISELIVPKLEEHDLRVLGSTSEQEDPDDDYADDTSSYVQNDGYYRYVENESPEQFEYSNAHDSESEAENQETESETIDGASEYYQNDEMADEDSEKSDDTFVVIPDESEIAEFSEVFDSSSSSVESEYQDLSDQNANENDASQDSMDFNVPQSYESQGVYSDADRSQYQRSLYSPSVEYAPGQYFQNEYFNPENEESSSPYDYEESYVADDAQAMNSEYHQYGMEANDPTNQLMYASPASYACQQQIGYGNCMYGPQTGYPYAGYYQNPYFNFPQGVSDVEESSESPVSDVDGSYSSESPMSYMIQSDSNMNNEQFEINPDDEIPNMYQDRNFDASEYEESPPDNSGAALKYENNVDQEETYYVLEDDDDKTTSEIDTETVSETYLDNMNAVPSDVTGNNDETYYILEDEDEEKVMQDETFSDASESEEIHKQHTSSQEKLLNLEEPSKDSVDVMPSQETDSKDVSQSEENPASDSDNAESLFGSTMDSRFTHATKDVSFTKSDRHENILLDSSERSGQNDETSELLGSSHDSLPTMFFNNMAYSDPINFGPHGIGSSSGQPMIGGSPTAFSFANGPKRSGDSASPNVSKLSALQERIRSLKQGKFGAFKKALSSGSKNQF